jgi:hypothetical protein
MSTKTNQVSPSYKEVSRFFARAGYFLWHFVEMCLAMCIGGIALNVLFFWFAERLGYANLFERFPEFSLLMVGINLAIPMTAWFRGHEWRPTLEMASTSIILPLLLIGAAWLSIIPSDSQLELLKRLACPVMLIPMLLRIDLYIGHRHHAAAAHSTNEHASHTG